MLADEIINTLGDAECVYFGTVEENIRNMTKEADIVFIGFWTDKGECSVGAAQYMETLRDRDVFLFGTAGFGGSPQYFSQILRRVSGCLPEGNTLAGTYMCQGEMPQSVRKRYETVQGEKPQGGKGKKNVCILCGWTGFRFSPMPEDGSRIVTQQPVRFCFRADPCGDSVLRGGCICPFALAAFFL